MGKPLTDEEIPPPVRLTQGWLIEWRNPLTTRLGRDFFLALPRCPGVYLMRDDGGRVIYVGKSRNLRQRVNSYRWIKPGNGSRKHLRLVHRVACVEIETCGDEEAALLRENALIREHRPVFNNLSTHPESHVFVALEMGREGLTLSWGNRGDQLPQPPVAEVFGAFGAVTAKGGLIALSRLLWWRGREGGTVHDLPHGVGGYPPPRRMTLELAAPTPAGLRRLRRKLRELFTGESDALVNRLCGKSGERLQQCACPWLRRILEADHEALRRFHGWASHRNFELKRDHGLRRTQVIKQAQLDDLVALRPLTRRTLIDV